MAFLHYLLQHDDEEYSELSVRQGYDQMQHGMVSVVCLEDYG